MSLYLVSRTKLLSCPLVACDRYRLRLTGLHDSLECVILLFFVLQSWVWASSPTRAFRSLYVRLGMSWVSIVKVSSYCTIYHTIACNLSPQSSQLIHISWLTKSDAIWMCCASQHIEAACAATRFISVYTLECAATGTLSCSHGIS